VVTVGYLLGDEFYRAATMTHQMARWIGLAGFILVVVVFVFLVERPKSCRASGTVGGLS